MSAITLTPDQEIVIFHYRLGVALTQWVYVEAALMDVAVNLMSSDGVNRQAVSTAILKAEGFRIKVSMIDAIVTTHLEAPLRSEWENLVGRARSLSSLRNDLVHWPMQKYWNCKPGKRVVLRPWALKEGDTHDKPPGGSKRVMDLVQAAVSFKALGDDVQEFFGKVFATGARLRESPEPANDQLTVQKLKLQICEVFSAPQKPSAKKP